MWFIVESLQRLIFRNGGSICALVCNLAHVTCSLPEVWPYRCKQNKASHEKLNDALKKFKGAVLMLGK